MSNIIELNHVSFTYQPNTPFAFTALNDVSLSVKEGSYTAIIGQTGSGKSTLLQQLNGLLQPTTGTVRVKDTTIEPTTKRNQLSQLRRYVGFVFQQPEAQLFEETVLKDIAFAPKNFGKTVQQAAAIARQKAQLVGLDEALLKKSPFELSGGQMRRVAIAGILALDPEVLILDEPTAGLDPKGRNDMMTLFSQLHASGLTVILVTHQMEDVAEFADEVIALAHGQVIAQTTPQNLFSNKKLLTDAGLQAPAAIQYAQLLKRHGFRFETLPLTPSQLAAAIAMQLKEGNDE